MVHQGQGLPLGLEAGDDLPESMPGLMILSATMRWTGCGLLGHEDGAHAAFADLLQQLVRADDGARAFGRVGGDPSPDAEVRPCPRARRPAAPGSCPAASWRSQQRLHAAAQVRVVAAGLVEVRRRSAGPALSRRAAKKIVAFGHGRATS